MYRQRVGAMGTPPTRSTSTASEASGHVYILTRHVNNKGDHVSNDKIAFIVVHVILAGVCVGRLIELLG